MAYTQVRPRSQDRFFKSLFDVTFTTFVTPSLATVVYVLWLFLSAAGMVALVIITAQQEGDKYIPVAVISPFAWFISAVFVRVSIEFTMVFFRIESNTRHGQSTWLQPYNLGGPMTTPPPPTAPTNAAATVNSQMVPTTAGAPVPTPGQSQTTRPPRPRLPPTNTAP